MNLTRLSVDRPVTITMLMAIVVVVGILSLSRLGVDMLPDIDYPTLSVMVRYPGAPSEEIETLVARPYEGALAGVNGVTKIQSISQEDVAYLLIDLEWGTDLDAAAADIREAVAMIEPFMPPDVEDPLVIKFNLTSMPQAIYIVSGMDDTVALRELLEDKVQARLERLQGVAQAPIMGGRVEEVQVNVDRAALLGSGVTLDQVALAIGAQNLNLPAGRQTVGHEELLLRTTGMFESLDDIRHTAVGISPRTMTPIEVGNLAEVVRTTRDMRNFVRANNTEALMLAIMKESGANPLRVRQVTRAKLAEIQEQLPQAVQIQGLLDMGRAIAKLGSAVVQNGLIGALLAVVVMYSFLRSVRPTLTIAVVIPLSLLATFIPIFLYGETLNMMTMGGLVLGIGMLVDNAVVVIEAIFRHIEEGKSRVEAAKLGAAEVGMAITASTLTTMAVFLPIFFATGLAGQLARGLAVTVAASLFASLFVAITIVPMLASVFFSAKDEGAVLHDGKHFNRFKSRYRRVLSWTLRHRVLTLASVGLLALLSIGLTPIVGAEFMPSNNSPILMGKISFPVGTSLETTAAASERIEEVLGSFSDVLAIGTQLGVDENDPGAALSNTNPTGPNEAIIFARLHEPSNRIYRDNADLQAAMRERIPEIEGMDFDFSSMASSMGGSTHAIEVKVYGDEFDTMLAASEQVEARLETVEGLVGIDTTFERAKPERHVRIDRAKVASYGLTVGQVASAIKTATLGVVATRYREAGDELDVRVRYAEPWRATPEDLEQLLIPLPTGGTIPLGQIAVLDEGFGPVRIWREDQTRVLTVVADLDGDTDLRKAMARIDDALGPLERQLPSDVRLEYGGQYEDMMEAFGQLLLALALAILLVYMVMASQFESFAHPLTIMFTMPLAFIGVVWIFLLTGTTLSVPTFLGVIMLAGIVVNNGIVLVDYINQLRAQGMELIEATLEGSATRLRPVLITSLTTVMAMVPMAVSRSEGSETMAPLGLTIIGGLMAATVFTLVVVPVVYTLIDGFSRWVSSRAMRLLHGSAA